MDETIRKLERDAADTTEPGPWLAYLGTLERVAASGERLDLETFAQARLRSPFYAAFDSALRSTVSSAFASDEAGSGRARRSSRRAYVAGVRRLAEIVLLTILNRDDASWRAGWPYEMAGTLEGPRRGIDPGVAVTVVDDGGDGPESLAVSLRHEGRASVPGTQGHVTRACAKTYREVARAWSLLHVSEFFGPPGRDAQDAGESVQAMRARAGLASVQAFGRLARKPQEAG